MSDQPEALRLADALEQQAAWEARYGPSELEELLPDSATLLRRQHAEIEALKAERDEDRRREYGYSQQTVDALTKERDALRAELLNIGDLDKRNSIVRESGLEEWADCAQNRARHVARDGTR